MRQQNDMRCRTPFYCLFSLWRYPCLLWPWKLRSAAPAAKPRLEMYWSGSSARSAPSGFHRK